MRAKALLIGALLVFAISLSLFTNDNSQFIESEITIDSISDEQIEFLDSSLFSNNVGGRDGDSAEIGWHNLVTWGGLENDSVSDVAIDVTGNVYVAGTFQGTATFGGTSLTSSGGNDIFIAKLSTSGSWQWAVKAGGSSFENVQGIAVDSSGNAYVTGYFHETATFGSTSLVSSGNYDIFIAKLSTSGLWQWAVKEDGSDAEGGYAISVDSSGNSYVTGYFQGTATFGSTSLTESGGSGDIFIAKLSTSGSWQWAVKAGGSFFEIGSDIAVDSSGNSYVTGYFGQTVTFGNTSLTSSGSYDVFIAKLSSSGSWQWAVSAGGSSTTTLGYGIAVDSSGNAYVTGYFSGTVDFGSTTLTSGSYDVFIAKLSSSGSWQWAVSAGGSDFDFGSSIAVDSSGNSYVTGYFQGTATFGSTTLTGGGDDDVFIAMLNGDGNFSMVIGSEGSESVVGSGIITDVHDNVFVSGTFSGLANFGDSDVISIGNTDSFLAYLVELDSDGDGVADFEDTCPNGDSNWNSSQNTDHDFDGCRDDGEDNDDDNDGIIDNDDKCKLGAIGWLSTNLTDYDSDGCRDDIDDNDDDDDGISDMDDSCEKGVLGWFSNNESDFDSDGCQDISEDDDDDSDGIIDIVDYCKKGALDWDSNASNDHDSDGCRDIDEDVNDDNDSMEDDMDRCPRGSINWHSNDNTDYDNDGCSDNYEDEDIDSDGVNNPLDSCRRGKLGWNSTITSDYDGDGCHDIEEDFDDDNDGIEDLSDNCPNSIITWVSTQENDKDQDGCHDSIEDNDQDGDGILDDVDNCNEGLMGWGSQFSNDLDRDGCRNDEDNDIDGDGVDNSNDNCIEGESDWLSNYSIDHDGDGCLDSIEDDDDDDDGILDSNDYCPRGKISWVGNPSNDFDSDGCHDLSEDYDDDNDGITDSIELQRGSDPLNSKSVPEDNDSTSSLIGWAIISSIVAVMLFVWRDKLFGKEKASNKIKRIHISGNIIMSIGLLICVIGIVLIYFSAQSANIDIRDESKFEGIEGQFYYPGSDLWTIYAEANVDCEYFNMTITNLDDGTTSDELWGNYFVKTSECKDDENTDGLIHVGNVDVLAMEAGNYSISNANSKVYIIDAGEEIGELAGGFLGGFVSIVILICGGVVILIGLVVGLLVGPSNRSVVVKTDTQEKNTVNRSHSNNSHPSTNLPEVRVIFPHENEKGSIGSDGYEWIVFPPGSQNNFYRTPGEEWKHWK